jgi:glutamyl-tRNA synthetase
LQVVGGPDVAEVPVHPEHDDRGVRELSVDGGVLVEGDDLPPHGERVWLKGFGCVEHTRDAFQYVDADLSVTREENVDIVHWVPADDNVRTRLRTMDGDVAGYAEPGVTSYDVDDLLQFERLCFARLDSDPAGDELVAYFTHP